MQLIVWGFAQSHWLHWNNQSNTPEASLEIKSQKMIDKVKEKWDNMEVGASKRHLQDDEVLNRSLDH